MRQAAAGCVDGPIPLAMVAGSGGGTATLHIRCLGTFEVWRDGQPIGADQWSTQKTRSLLRILVTHRGNVVQAEQLFDYLWPDLDPVSAANNLRVAVSRLRRVIEPRPGSGEGRQSPRYVVTRRPGYLFDPAGCWIDVDEFEKLFNRGREALRQGLADRAIAQLREAAALYRGDYLDDEPYADWATLERERLRVIYLELLGELARALVSAGRRREATQVYHQALAKDACRESVYRELMQLYWELGEQAEAVRTFERCRQVLEEELGVDPTPMTVELYRAVLQGTPPGGPIPQSSAEQHGPPGAPAAPIVRSSANPPVPVPAPPPEPAAPSGPAAPPRPLPPSSGAAPSGSVAPPKAPVPAAVRGVEVGAGAGDSFLQQLGFVGRDDAITALLAHSQVARTGRGRLVVVQGEAGVGKTRLLEEFVARIRPEFAVLRSAAYELEQGIPYQPLIEGLRQVVSLLGSLPAMPGEIRPWAAHLVPMLPELEEAMGPHLEEATAPQAMAGPTQGLQGPQGPSNGASQRPGALLRDGEAGGVAAGPVPGRERPTGDHRFFEAVFRLLRVVAVQRPVIWLIDDLQWADHASLQLLHYLIRRCAHCPVLVVATLRTAEAGPAGYGAGLAKLLSSLAREGLVFRQGLKPLEVSHVEELLGPHLVPQRRMRALAGWLHAETRGNGFFLIETLRWLASQGAIVRGRDLRWYVVEDFARLPDAEARGLSRGGENMTEMILSRFRGISDRARRLLYAAAVAGTDWDVSLLSQVTGETEEAVLEAAEELMGTNAVTEGAGGLRFSHPKVRELVYEAMGSHRRRILHLRVAQALASRQPGDSLPAEAALALHYYRGQGWAQAALHSFRAGEAAMALHAFAEAFHWFEQALDAASRYTGEAPALDQRFLAQLHLGFARAALALGRSAQAATGGERAVELALGAGEKALAIEALNLSALGAHSLNRLETMMSLAGRALVLAEEVGDRPRAAESLRILARAHNRLGQLPQAYEAGRRAEALCEGRAEEAMPPGTVASVQGTLALILWDLGRYGEAIRSAGQAVELYRRIGSPRRLAVALNDLGEIYQDLMLTERALACHQEALSLSRDMGDAHLTSDILKNLGMDYLFAGDRRRALAQLGEAWKLARSLGSPYRTEIVLRAMVEAFLLLGKLAHAERYLSRMLEVTGPREAAFLPVFKGALAFARGNVAEGERLLQGALSNWRRTGHRAREFHLHFFVARCAQQWGDEELARKEFARTWAMLWQVAGQLPPELREELLATPMARISRVEAGPLARQADGLGWPEPAPQEGHAEDHAGGGPPVAGSAASSRR